MINEKNILKINFLVNNQIIKRIDKNIIVADSINYLKATFKFTEDWKDTKKQIYLQNYDGYCRLYDLPESNEFIIPSEYVKSKGFKIAIKGVIDNTVIKTNNIDVYNESTQITTSDLVIPVIETVNFGEGEREWILSSTLSLYRNGEIYTIDIPDTILNYTSEDDTIHLKKLDSTDLTSIQLPHKENIEKLEEWTQQSFENVDEVLNDLADKEDSDKQELYEQLNDEITNRKNLTGHSLQVSQAKEHIIDIDLINANGESISHQEINLDDEHIIDSVYLDYTNKKLIFTFKDGHSIDCDLTDMIKDLQNEITKVNSRIDALDYYNAKLDGEYIDGITQTGGLISATKKSFDTVLTDTSVIAPQSKVVKTYVDAETLRAETAEDSLGDNIVSLSEDLSDINSRLNSEILRANQSEAQIQAKLEIETNNRVDTDNTLQSNIDDVNDALNELDDRLSKELELEIQNRKAADETLQNNIDDVNKRIDDLDYSSTNSSDKTITSITQTDGKVNVVYDSITIIQSQITDAVTGSEVDNMLEEVFN